MTKIYLIRHAEAEGNLYRRAQGHYNANVTALGRAQISALAERFREIPIDALWSSDLNRTQSTAAAILKYHPQLTLHTTPALREIDVGVWEDTPWGNIRRDMPEQMQYFTYDPARWHVPGSEPYENVAARMKKAVLELADAYEGGTVAAVTHGLAVRALLCSLFGVPSAEISRLPYGDNTSVALLTAENGRLNVEWYNDASHLDGGLSTFSRQAWRRKEGQTHYTTFEPLDPRREGELYTRCYANTWQASHGDLEGFTPIVYLRTAERHAAHDPRTLMKLYRDGELAGLVELDPDRGADIGAGWVSLVYIEPALRAHRLGVQLIGHAVSYFRRAGRRSLRLHVSQTNETALGFYRSVGFREAGTSLGVGGPLYLMELDVTQRVLSPEEI